MKVTLKGGPRDGETINVPDDKREIVLPAYDAYSFLAIVNDRYGQPQRIRHAFYQNDPHSDGVFTFRYMV